MHPMHPGNLRPDGSRPFDLAALLEIDGGRFAEEVKFAMRQITQDLASRPGLKTKRKINIELTFEPHAEIDPDTMQQSCGGVEVDFVCKHSVPPVRGRSTSMALEGSDKGHELRFMDLSPRNAKQRTLESNFAADDDQD